MEKDTDKTITADDLQQRLAEAEERGYRRGLNEQIDARMAGPGLWEGSAGAAPDTGDTDDSGGYTLLADPPRSVWDD